MLLETRALRFWLVRFCLDCLDQFNRVSVLQGVLSEFQLESWWIPVKSGVQVLAWAVEFEPTSLRPSRWTAAGLGWPPWRSSCMGPQVRPRFLSVMEQELDRNQELSLTMNQFRGRLKVHSGSCSWFLQERAAVLESQYFLRDGLELTEQLWVFSRCGRATQHHRQRRRHPHGQLHPLKRWPVHSVCEVRRPGGSSQVRRQKHTNIKTSELWPV